MKIRIDETLTNFDNFPNSTGVCPCLWFTLLHYFIITVNCESECENWGEYSVVWEIDGDPCNYPILTWFSVSCWFFFFSQNSYNR